MLILLLIVLPDSAFKSSTPTFEYSLLTIGEVEGCSAVRGVAAVEAEDMCLSNVNT